MVGFHNLQKLLVIDFLNSMEIDSNIINNIENTLATIQFE
jgi:archaellum component FlaD/FlaE